MDAQVKQAIEALYNKYAEIPYISDSREASWLEQAKLSSSKLVPKRNMVRLENGLLPGHIILLWRVQFGTYTTDVAISKYFEYTYGIDAVAELDKLIADGYVVKTSAIESLDLLTAPVLKNVLIANNITQVAKLKKDELVALAIAQLPAEVLDNSVPIRRYALTALGKQTLDKYPEVVAKHPQKKF